LTTSAKTSALQSLRVVELAIAIGIAYFLAARFGLTLTSHAGLAVFWPAAGIATGALIVLGPASRLAVAIAVAVASMACNLTVGRNPWIAIPFSLVNAGYPLITAWLIGRWFGDGFKLEEVSQVLGFLAASAIAAAIGAAGAVITVRFVEAAVFPLQVWRIWLSADLLGTVTVGPLLIGLGEAIRNVPPRRELIEGAVAIATLSALCTWLISMPQGPWSTALPVALVFPILLSIAVRCRPVFAAAAMFVATLAVILSATFNLEHFGDASIPFADRILAAQTLVLAGTVLTLVLAALFSERRRSEAALQKNKERLQLALDGAALGAFSVDLATGQLECDARAAHCLGYTVPPRTIRESRRFVRPDDLMHVDAAFAEAERTDDFWNIEYRVQPPTGHPHAGETRWIGVESSIQRDRKGKAVGLLGVTRDITERKRADQKLGDLEVQRALAGRFGLVGTYAYDTDEDSDVEEAQISSSYAAIHGLPEGTTEITRSAWLARVHPEDAKQLQVLRSEAFRKRRQEYSVDYRIVRGGEVRWIESRTFITYSGEGRPQRVIGVNIDVTERKRTEALLRESKDRLADAMAAGHVLAFEWDAVTGLSQRSENAAQVLGSELRGKEFISHVHAEDRKVLQTHIRNLSPGKPSYTLNFRYASSDGREAWLEETAKGEFGAAGKLLRIKGLTRDITNHKRAELALVERNAQFVLAHKAARVGTFAYDNVTRVMQFSEASAEIWGLSQPQSTIKISGDQWRARVHHDDVRRLREAHVRAFKERQRELVDEFRVARPSGEVRWIEARTLISYNAAGRALRMIGVYIDVTERKEANDHKDLLIAELDHRVKNVLACVVAVAQHTRESATSVREFLDLFDGRIASLANTHTLLSRNRWQGVNLAELVGVELAPCMTNGNALTEGPDIMLAAEAAQPIAIVLHELATNATKYGAFSTIHGRVSVRWQLNPDSNPLRQLVVLEWRETRGPPVTAPTVRGYGTSVIRDLIPYELGGSVDYTLSPEGVYCRLEIPAKWLANPIPLREILQDSDAALKQ
jgi:PAS domain S-box-containing protein